MFLNLSPGQDFPPAAVFFFYNDQPPPELSPLPLHDALPTSASATKQAIKASVSRSGSTPPRRKNTPIPVNSADSPTRSSVESKKAPKGVLMPPSRATRP